jgi:hypothetical protein
VKRCNTVTEFERALVRIRGQYELGFEQATIEVRQTYAEGSLIFDAARDQLLEAHARIFIDQVLEALNWQTGVGDSELATNLTPEAPVRSLDVSTVRFLDYLGYEVDNPRRPLLIVETKRPGAGLPRRQDAFSDSDDPVNAIVQGLKGEKLANEWSSWLGTARDYFRSTAAKAEASPKRVVITNGSWLVIFADPGNAFNTSEPDSNSIYVSPSRSEIVRQADLVFSLLEHQRLTETLPPLKLNELLFYIAGSEVDKLMYGVRLLYQSDADFYAAMPSIKVRPLIHVRTKAGVWLIVEDAGSSETLPGDPDQLSEHYTQFASRAGDLLDTVQSRLGISSLSLLSLREHYQEAGPAEYPIGLLGVKRKHYPAHDEYVVATGREPHYFRLIPSVANCPFHSLAEQGGAAVGSRTIDPPAFFIVGQDQRCCHGDVHQTKRNRLTPENRTRCGPRSGANLEAFCEIFQFEQYLCCRTCAFESVCTSAEVFYLPCHTAPD